MRTRAVVASIVASLGVLIVGWDAGAAGLSSGSTTSAPSNSSPFTGSATASSPAGASASTGKSATAPAPSNPADGTHTGPSVGTQFGAVQVQVTIAGGQITDVTALQLTDRGGRSVMISNRAAPILRQEVLASQSASVSNVSGATYTTRAYLMSLQSALDAAGF